MSPKDGASVYCATNRFTWSTGTPRALATRAVCTWADAGLKLRLNASRIRPTVTLANPLPAPFDMRERIGKPISEVPGLFGRNALGRFVTFNRGPIISTHSDA